jgi:acetyl esterase/lipase
VKKPIESNYNDFPKSIEEEDGIKIIKAEIDKYNVKLMENIIYSKRNEKELKLQILIPVSVEDTKHEGTLEKGKKYPTIVYIPGSAWFTQNVINSVPLLYGYAKEGYVVVLVEYCGTDAGGQFPTHIYDAKQAIRFIKQHAEEYNVDVDKVVVFGDSSGGHTALLCGITAENELLEQVETKMSYNCSVCGIIDFYGPTDIRKMNDVDSIVDHTGSESPEGYLIGKKSVPENPLLSKEVAIKNYIKKDQVIPPIIMFHGNKDRLVPFQQSVLLYRELKEHNKDVQFYCMDNADHGGTCFWTKNIKDIVIKFINECIKHK